MYILPMLPMMAVASAPYLESIVAAPWFRRLLMLMVVVLGLVFAGAGIAALTGNPSFETRIEAERGLPPGDDKLWWLLLATGASMLIACLWFRRNALKAAGVALSLLVVLLFSGTAVLLDAENSARGVMERGRELAGNATLGLVGWKEQNLLQAVGPVEEFGFKRPFGEQLRVGISWMEMSPDTRRLFVFDGALDACVLRSRAVRVGTANRRDWWLLDASAIAPECRGTSSP
jgi:hypothetical protein